MAVLRIHTYQMQIYKGESMNVQVSPLVRVVRRGGGWVGGGGGAGWGGWGEGGAGGGGVWRAEGGGGWAPMLPVIH